MFSATLKILLFTLLAIATLCSAAFVDRYQEVGLSLLQPAVSKWQSHGRVTVKDSNGQPEIVLHSPDTKTNTQVYQTISIPLAGKKVRLRAMLQTRGVVAGEKSWNKARLLLLQYRDGKAQYSSHHVASALAGTNEWQEISKVFTVLPDTEACRLVVQLSRSKGEFSVTGLSLCEVEETVLYGRVQWLIRGAWILFALLLFMPNLKTGKLIVRELPVLVTVAAILVGTTMPAAVKNDLAAEIVESWGVFDFGFSGAGEGGIARGAGLLQEHAGNQGVGVEKVDITKVAHFVLFGVLALLLRLISPARPVRLLILDLFMLACATELSQFFIDDRSPLFTDILIDMVGAGSGLAITRSFQGNFIS